MMILCGVISRGTTILAKYIQVAGSNMNEFIEKVLEKVSVRSEPMNSYTHGEFMIHYICQQGIVYLAITQQGFPQDKVLEFLEEVMEKFQRYVGDRARSALAYSFNGEFGEVLKNGMLRATPSKIDSLNEDMNDVKVIMIQNIDKALERGERMYDLLLKTDDLQTNSTTFRRQAVQIQNKMWYVSIAVIPATNE